MLIKRRLFTELVDHLSSKEISLVVGPRQAGKTTLIKAVQDYLNKKGEKTVYLNLDVEADKQFFDSQDRLIKKIKLEAGAAKAYIFIDEIQRKENAALFLKGLYDLELPYKFIISGSGSLELKEKIHESLAGRKRIFELGPVDFFEFVDFKTDYKYGDHLVSFLETESAKRQDLLEEYLNFGGYPRVILATELEEKNKQIGEIVKSYLERDIVYLLKVEKGEAFGRMIKLLASQSGRLLNYSKLSADLNISLPTLKNYLWYAEKTFVLELVSPYFKNIKKEIIKSPVVYFNDLGLRNYSLNLFGNLFEARELGFLFQNLAFKILKNKFTESNNPIHFWRTKDGAEVDFVVELGNSVLPIEVKFSSLKKENIDKSMMSFIDKYEPKETWVINLDLHKTIKIKNTKVVFLPFYLIPFCV